MMVQIDQPTLVEESQRQIADEAVHELEESHSAVYLLRTTQQHHVQLSAMADAKANILVGACLLVVSLCFGQMWRTGFSLTLTLWGLFSLVCAAVGVLAVLPRAGKPKNVDLPQNLLFFGTFTNMDLETYTRKMLEVMKTEEGIRRAMVNDIYQLGQVLRAGKFRYLSIGYRLFLFGLGTTAVSGVMEFVLHLW